MNETRNEKYRRQSMTTITKFVFI